MHAHRPGASSAESPGDEVVGSVSIGAVAKLSKDLIDEIDGGLASSRWAVLPNERMMAALHACAGVAHCTYLLEEIIAAHDRDAEITGRVLARSLFETWLIAYFIHLGGYEALERVAGSYLESLQRQHTAIAAQNAALDAARRRVKRHNRGIRRTNDHLRRWNAAHPNEPQKVLIDELNAPPGEILEFDLSSYLERWKGVPMGRLSNSEVVAELGRLTKERGREETYADAYNLAYRGLSTLGAHATLFVLNSYLDDRGGKSSLIRVRRRSHFPSSFEEPNLQMALLLTAVLAHEVFAARGTSVEVAAQIIQRFNVAFGSGQGSEITGDRDS